MKKLKIMLLVVLALGLCSAILGADAKASLVQSELRSFKIDFANSPQIQESNGSEPYRATVLSEGFSSATFPPAGWINYDLDGIGKEWSRATNRYHSSPASARHEGGGTLALEHRGLLVTPLISIDDMELKTLTFWNYTESPGNMLADEGHMVLYTSDPSHENWYILWDEDQPSASWEKVELSLDRVGSEPVYFGFYYQSRGFFSNTDTWYIDDVEITTTNVKILPVINTPNPDLNRYVEATIKLDAGVDEAILWYSYDNVTWYASDMQEDLDTTEPDIWWSVIPAGGQMNQEVFYKVWVKDLLGYECETDVYSYKVQDPVWVFYDYGVNEYQGIMPANLGNNTWGAFNFFHNPFHGTGASLYLYRTEAASFYPQSNVHLQIYFYTPAEDGEYALSRSYFDTPPAVNMTGLQGGGWDIFEFADFNNSEPIEITDQFFAIAFENLPNTGNDNTNSYFIFNMKYDYGMCGSTHSNDPGAWYIFTDVKGTWAISAEIGFGQILEVPVPGLEIAMFEGYPNLTWNAVDNALSYNLYGSPEPYIPLEDWTCLHPGLDRLDYQYIDTLANPRMFFYVTASSKVDGSKANGTSQNENLRCKAHGQKTQGAQFK